MIILRKEAPNRTNAGEGDLVKFSRITHALIFQPAVPLLGIYPESASPSKCARARKATLFIVAGE